MYELLPNYVGVYYKEEQLIQLIMPHQVRVIFSCATLALRLL